MNIPQLTFTRFIAAIAIVAFHYFGLHYPFNIPEIKKFVDFSYIFVSYFFVLSGFILVISRSESKIDFIPYIIKRIGRLYPIYLFALLLTVISSLIFQPNFKTVFDCRQLFSEIFMIQAWFPMFANNVYNYPSWSLSVEILFYVLFPSLLYLMNSFKDFSKIVIYLSLYTISISIYIYCFNHNIGKLFINYFPPLHLSSFLAGMIGGIFFIKYKLIIDKYKNTINVFTLLSVSILIILIHFENNFIQNYSRNGLLSPIFLMIIFSICLLTGKIANILSSKYLIFLGEISYGIYILQHPTMIIVKGLFNNFLKLGSLYQFLFLPFLLLLSAITFILIEKPARLYIANKFVLKYNIN